MTMSPSALPKYTPIPSPSPSQAPRRAATFPAVTDRVSLGENTATTCPDPRSLLGGPTPLCDAEVRAAVRPTLERVAVSDCTGVNHTTRNRPTVHHPHSPEPFAAGRFAVSFRDREKGAETAFIFETEDGPGHLSRVVPGDTVIAGGYVSILADPGAPFGAATRLTSAEVDFLTEKIYARFATPMDDGQAEKLSDVIGYADAIRFSGQGSAAVTARHAQLEAGLHTGG